MNKEEFEKHVISEAKKMLREASLEKKREVESVTLDDIKSLADACKDITETFEFNFISEGATPKKKVIPSKQFSRFENLVEYKVQSDDERDSLSEVIKEENVYNEIKFILESELNKVQEVSVLEEAFVDTIKKYLKTGALTVAIMANLMSNNLVSAEQLEKAGVESDKIEMAADQAGISTNKPEVFNFAVVRGMAINDTLGEENISKLKASFDISDYNSSDKFKFVSVPYKLTTSENLNTGWGHKLAASYDEYSDNELKGFTDNKNYSVIASKNESPITYNVSEYPMTIDHNGETLEFLGVYIIKSNPRNKNAFFDNKGVNFAKLSSGNKEFIDAKGKSSISVKGNSISIALVYGKDVKDANDSQDTDIEGKFHDLFKYNRTDVQTESESYQELIDSVSSFMKKYPNKKFSLEVHGSASQVPTSYDSGKPNNNLGKDFKSIPGEASIENNKMLAQDRAKSLLKQILLDLKSKDSDVLGKIGKVKTTSEIGKIKYEDDPENTKKYLEDQYVKIKMSTI